MAPNWVPADDNRAWLDQQSLYAGIGDGAGLSPATGASGSSLPPEICVTGAPLGEVRYGGRGRDGRYDFVAYVYSSVTVLQPATSPNVIGVWIDGGLYNQVHW
jgi:hypothetical protein